MLKCAYPKKSRVPSKLLFGVSPGAHLETSKRMNTVWLSRPLQPDPNFSGRTDRQLFQTTLR